MTYTHLATFATHLIHDLALPELAAGYLRLVEGFRQDEALVRRVREDGVTAIFANDDSALAGLRKHNKELVTAFEKDAERKMTLAVKEAYPEHSVVGEEHGVTPGNHMRWVFDPVDGTSAMIQTALAEACDIRLSRPNPSFGITVGLVEDTEPVVGVVVELSPQTGGLVAKNSWVGAKGQATSCNGTPIILPPAPATLAEATLACTVPEVMFHSAETWGGYQALAEAVTNCMRDQNCIGYMQLLQGGVNVVYEADLAYHDAAALIPVLQAVGITVSDAKGSPVDFSEAAIGKAFSLLAAQPILHKLAIEKVRRGVAPERNSFVGKPQHQGYAQKFPDGS